jgi:(p)ppGpp synthase/HD superfamily hydrolase
MMRGVVADRPPPGRTEVDQTVPTVLTDRFAAALRYAADLHRDQVRKGTAIPYVAHLLAVAALVLEQGGTEEMAIGALLHDAVEDQPGRTSPAEIGERFGEGVARIVADCTDADRHPKPPWRERKEAYVAHLAEVPEASLRVSLADKLHNARAIVADARLVGPALWDRFNAGPQDQVWYYTALAAAFRRRLPDDPTVALFAETVQALAAEARAVDGVPDGAAG